MSIKTIKIIDLGDVIIKLSWKDVDKLYIVEVFKSTKTFFHLDDNYLKKLSNELKTK